MCIARAESAIKFVFLRGSAHCNRSDRARKAIPAVFLSGVAANPQAGRWPRRHTIKRLAEVSTYAKNFEWSLRDGA
jgi:hypothetical protein